VPLLNRDRGLPLPAVAQRVRADTDTDRCSGGQRMHADTSRRQDSKGTGMVLTASDPMFPTTAEVRLTRVQQWAYDGLQFMLPATAALAVSGPQGYGKSTVLRALHRNIGGALITPSDFMRELAAGTPLALEETLVALIRAALDQHTAVFVDDLDLLQTAMHADANPRKGLVSAALVAAIDEATARGKKLIFAGSLPCEVTPRCFSWGLQPYQAVDYAGLLANFLGEDVAGSLDASKIFRFAQKLNAYQLREACLWLGRRQQISTDQMIGFIRDRYSLSNVDIQEVQEVEFGDLKGLDDLLDELETHVILPLENDTLAAELQLRPKRGVLLAGPPGTGKTTVGRVLARRLGSKFFLIDGTVIAGSHTFYDQIQRIFSAAKESGDCIIFIDDSDVIFEARNDSGLYRYLLTMLDGLESKSAGRVCVMMTAMNAGKLPPALVRSGRIELWLETRLPDVAARQAILEQYLAPVTAALGAVNVEMLAAEADGFTGADLRRIVEDGKLLLARDKAAGRPISESTGYFRRALGSLRTHRERYLSERATITR